MLRFDSRYDVWSGGESKLSDPTLVQTALAHCSSAYNPFQSYCLRKGGDCDAVGTSRGAVAHIKHHILRGLPYPVRNSHVWKDAPKPHG